MIRLYHTSNVEVSVPDVLHSRDILISDVAFT